MWGPHTLRQSWTKAGIGPPPQTLKSAVPLTRMARESLPEGKIRKEQSFVLCGLRDTPDADVLKPGA